MPHGSADLQVDKLMNFMGRWIVGSLALRFHDFIALSGADAAKTHKGRIWQIYLMCRRYSGVRVFGGILPW